jgi:hypothetical protein
MGFGADTESVWCPGGVQGPPRAVTFVALTDIASSVAGRDLLLSQAASVYRSPTAEVRWVDAQVLCRTFVISTRGVGLQRVANAVIASYNAPKQKLLITCCETRDLTSALYFCKAADVVVLVTHAAGGHEGLYDSTGSTFLTALKAQGMPAIVGLIQGMDTLTAKKQTDMSRYCTRYAHGLRCPGVLFDV